jgi:hypothetical protein
VIGSRCAEGSRETSPHARAAWSAGVNLRMTTSRERGALCMVRACTGKRRRHKGLARAVGRLLCANATQHATGRFFSSVPTYERPDRLGGVGPCWRGRGGADHAVRGGHSSLAFPHGHRQVGICPEDKKKPGTLRCRAGRGGGRKAPRLRARGPPRQRRPASPRCAAAPSTPRRASWQGPPSRRRNGA